MRKRDMVIIVIFISVMLLLLFACVSLPLYPKKELGPLVIVVTDNETGLPLSNITCYYQLQKVRPFMLVDVRYITIDIQKLKTDRNGEITIPAKKYSLGVNENFLCKTVFINLDTKNNGPPPRDMYNFSSYFSLYSGRDDVIIVDRNYLATAVSIFALVEGEERKETTSFTNDGCLRYSIIEPFDENEMKFSVKLARNTN